MTDTTEVRVHSQVHPSPYQLPGPRQGEPYPSWAYYALFCFSCSFCHMKLSLQVVCYIHYACFESSDGALICDVPLVLYHYLEIHPCGLLNVRNSSPCVASHHSFFHPISGE